MKRFQLLVLVAFFGLVFVAFAAADAGAKEAKTQKWRMATSWPGGVLLDQARLFADNVETLTEGRLVIQVFPGGTLGNPLKVPETVQKGLAQIGHSWTAYEWGKDKTNVLFPSWPGGPQSSEALLHWYYEGGGQHLLQEFYQEKYGLKTFVASAIPAEVVHSRKPVRTLDDLQGLKFRTTGAWIEIAGELGASTVSTAGTELYQMLERGAIDATEWASPSSNIAMGFHETAPYIIVPGIHQPANALQVFINPRAWDALSPRDQTLVAKAAKLTAFESWLQTGMKDIAAIKDFRAAGNEFITLEPAVKEEALRLSEEWAAKEASQNEWFAKVWQSQKDFMAQWDVVDGIR